MRELHAYKRAQGYPMVDPAREQRLLDALVAGNPGPARRRRAARRCGPSLLALLTREAARLLDEAERR